MFSSLQMSTFERIFTIFIGIAMVISNIGARFLVGGISTSKKRESLLSDPNMRYLYVFCMGFVATRDIILASILVCLYELFMRLTAD